MDLAGKTILITGGTGSFGQACIRTLLADRDPGAIRILSRDELKQSQLMAEYRDEDRLRFLIGDVRDLERLRMATRGVDLVIHAAALKHVVVGEYNPLETALTNVTGTANVITAAIENNVRTVVGISTDKAPNSTTLYGATKLVAERLLAQASAYSGGHGTRFGCVRYGNVLASRGSVIPIFKEQAKTGTITVTDVRMTRFWLSLPDAIDFVLSSVPLIRDGECFVPKIPSSRIVDLARAIAPNAEIVFTGIRAGEKLHEVLLTEDEARYSRDLGDRFMILPHRSESAARTDGEPLPDGFRFASDTNPDKLGIGSLRRMVYTDAYAIPNALAAI